VAKAQTNQAQGQQQTQGQQHKQQQQQPAKPARETKTYAGRIGIKPNQPTGYYRQPAPLKLATASGDEYRRKEGGGGRGRGGQGGQSKGRGGGRGQGNQEFRAVAYSLYVSGFPEYADEASVTEHFKHFGAIKGVHFPTDKNFCFVHFESQEGIDKAMATEDELLWDGYELWYEPKKERLPTPKGAPRGGGGNENKGKGGNENKNDKNDSSSSGKSQQPQKQQSGGNKSSN
jgi:hypothetical protein